MTKEEEQALLDRAKELVPSLKDSIFTMGIKKNPEQIEQFLYECAQQLQATSKERLIEVIGEEMTSITEKLFF